MALGPMPTRDSPVSKLSDDVLYFIFWDFKYLPHPWMFEGNNRSVRRPSERPLTIIQRCSQVCRRWRNIILGSTIIWGRLIDLDLLRQKEDHWRNEVLRRSGDSAELWITSFVREMPPAVEEFLLDILKQHWNRIGVLDVSLDEGSPVPHLSLEIFSRPAPVLRRFAFFIKSGCAINRRTVVVPTLPLFADSSPMLREFSTLHIALRLSTPWFANLRELQTFALADDLFLFNALASMPFLEKLSADGERLDDLTTEQPISYKTPIQLPRLQMISLKGCLRTCLALAGCIIPAPGCGLLLKAMYLSGVALSKDVLLPSFHSTIHRWVANFLDHNKSNTTLEFRIQSSGTMITIDFLSSGHSFYVSVHCNDGCLDRADDLAYFLSPLKPFSPPSHFSRMKELRLDISPSFNNTPPIVDFLLSLSSVEAIQTNHRTLEVLRGLCHHSRNKTELFFPLLQELTVKEGPDLFVRENFVEIIKSYLQHRRNVGRRVGKLELRSIGSVVANVTTEAKCRKEFGRLVGEMTWSETNSEDYVKSIVEGASV